MKKYDCIFAGEICIDLPINPIPLDVPIIEHSPIELSSIDYVAGGVVSNGCMVLSTLGLQAVALGCVGQDVWADVLLEKLHDHGVDISHIISLPEATSACLVLVGSQGGHCFAYHAGASQKLNASMMLENMDIYHQSRYLMLGYYGLMRSLTPDLQYVLPKIKKTGCRIALDAAFGGGKLQPLDNILPYLDIYIPSYEEASQQTGEAEPHKMLQCFRQYSRSDTLLGIKLGANGALLSPSKGEFITIDPVILSSEVKDTTGAGDSFYAGLIAGLIKGYSVEASAKIASAAGACCITEIGTIAGVKNFQQTCQFAGVKVFPT
ncbi:carbohydrate kinase family protein [Shewanella surugensis]|uniref:Carbohydrate kinase family protein n=1 Tax=Shewanella surugensis TaxID=212020 RepID=A0ABT0L9J0_9GAMM|nr:carbohydrate kinase family protein [Shewanella surugensis]MCL1124381.1 carbohydrate kinase family protein [Shewanella surugensis]